MIYELKSLSSRAATAENPRAEVGAGGQANNGRKGAPCIWPFVKGTTHVLLDTEGPGMIRHIWCTIPPGQADHLRNVILRIYWDDQDHPSVETPLGDFFGIAHGRQRPLVTDFVSMQSGKGLNCWIPMPFRKRARITVENDSSSDVGMFFYQIDFTLGDELDDNTGYFHAQFRRSNPCPILKDYVILDGVQGRGVYLGTVLGVRSIFRDGWWGEGEVKFYLDGDSDFPTICGTGTEDYMGDAWGLQEVVTPYQGAPLVDWNNGLYSLYRFHAKDPIYFQNDIKVTVQQIGFGSEAKARAHFGEDFHRYPAAGLGPDADQCYFEISEDWSSVAYWYQSLPSVPFPSLPEAAERTRDILDLADSQRMERNDV